MAREKRIEGESAQYLETLRFLNETTQDYLFLLDFGTRRILLFRDMHDKFDLPETREGGYSFEEWEHIIYERDRTAFREEIKAIGEGKRVRHELEYRLVDRSGTRIWVNSTGTCRTNDQGKPWLIVGRATNMVLGRKTDTLTGLLNEEKLMEDLAECLTEKTQGYLLVLGVDNFKNLNMKYGRVFGNRVLKNIADALDEMVSSSVNIYRLDGDRFAVNLTGQTRENAEYVYTRLQERMAGMCTISAGAVHYGDGMETDEGRIFQYAENAMESAKKGGKNALMFFSNDDYIKNRQMVNLQAELQKSIQNEFDGFFLCYQPQIDLETFNMVGAEALLRYNSATRGLVGPAEFIPILEQTGLINQVGRWVLKMALIQCGEWRKQLSKFRISVNVSYVQLRKDDAEFWVLKLLEELDIPGEALVLELTESMQLQDYQYYNRIFYRWEKAGIQISIDDFGTGYSSLGYLKSIETNEVKIDRCFIRGIRHSAYNYNLLSNMIALAHSAQIRVCCEGVETEEELLALRELGPDLLQGFLFARPYTKEVFEEMYLNGESEEYKKRQERENYFISLSRGSGLEPEQKLEMDALGLVVENMEELICICDSETGELWYLNSTGRRLTGCYDYKGRKCFELMQNSNIPCSQCSGCKNKKNEFYVWETKNRHLNRHFIMKSKQIPWRGRTARLVIGIDVTEKEVRSQIVQERLNFEQNIMECTKMLVEEPNMEIAIRKVLEALGAFYQADRTYILEPGEDGQGHWQNTYEWHGEGVSSQTDLLERIPAHLVRRWIESFEAGQSIVVDNREELLEKWPEEYAAMKLVGVTRLLATPIWRNKKLIGCVAVDNPGHRQLDNTYLETMACFLADRVIRIKTEARLNDLLDCRYEDILNATSLGLWVIRLKPDGERAELFADSIMQRVIAAPKGYTPEQVYQHWYGRINDGYYNYVNAAVERMIESNRKVQLEYTWNHPEKGEVVVRCTGIRVEDSDGMICLEGYHRIVSDVEKPRFLPDATASIMFEYNETKKSIYFHTERELLAGELLKEENFPECWIDSDMVHPYFAEEFRLIFSHVRNKEISHGMEMLLKTRHGTYEWFKLRTRHLGKDKKDRNTIVVLLDPANRERVMEIEYMRKNDFYEAMLSETIAYAEVDVTTDDVISSGGLWDSYKGESQRWGETFTQVLERHIKEVLLPEDQDKCLNYLRSEYVNKMYQGGSRTGKFRFQRIIGERILWVELVVHVFQERFTENRYALMYLKDIDVEKKREIEQERAARRDGLTGMYNRSGFEKEVSGYMKRNPKETGMFLLVDVDDFKRINDQYGHLEGDAALKKFALTLKNVFRKGGIIGRLGGDEFTVFVKKVNTVEEMDRKMAELFRALKDAHTIPLTCSVGITFAHGDNFSYERSLRQTDTALYESKNRGKNTYTYYDAGSGT